MLILSWIIYLKADVVISRAVQCVKFRWTVRELLCIFSKLKRTRPDSNPYRIFTVGKDLHDQVQPWLNTTMATQSCCEALILLFFFSLNALEMVTPTLPWAACSKSLFTAKHFGNLLSWNCLKIWENGPRLEWQASTEGDLLCYCYLLVTAPSSSTETQQQSLCWCHPVCYLWVTFGWELATAE